MIIGLTGSLSAGKGVVSDFLKEKGFVYLSLSDELREIAKQRKIELTRENLQNLGNQMREENGSGVLAKIVSDKIKNQNYTKAIVDGIRNPAEIEELRKMKDFFLICVDAPQEIRFKRMQERNRESDPTTWEEFLRVDARDKGVGEAEHGQGVSKCMEQADFVLINDESFEEVRRKLRELYGKIEQACLEKYKVEKRKDYLSWDEYFMGLAFLSSMRSKDPNTQTGATIVDQNKKIVGIGYNGFPIGCSDDCLPWAREGDFVNTKYAYVCHAELNAILNSIKNLSGCILYATLFPCNECAKAIIQSGIKEVVYFSDKYNGTDLNIAAKKMFNQAGIKLRQLISFRNPLVVEFKD